MSLTPATSRPGKLQIFFNQFTTSTKTNYSFLDFSTHSTYTLPYVPQRLIAWGEDWEEKVWATASRGSLGKMHLKVVEFNGDGFTTDFSDLLYLVL